MFNELIEIQLESKGGGSYSGRAKEEHPKKIKAARNNGKLPAVWIRNLSVLFCFVLFLSVAMNSR